MCAESANGNKGDWVPVLFCFEKSRGYEEKNEIKGRKFEKRRNKNKNRWQKILKNEKTVLHEF